LVDLPGYGYARAARTMRGQWEKTIEQYLLKRSNLMSTFILIDSRLPLQEIDRKIINWFGKNSLHFILVLTKTDKLTVNTLNANFEAIKKEILKDWEVLPPVIFTSAKTEKGRGEILAFIENANHQFEDAG
jgi:GTP-binding protein